MRELYWDYYEGEDGNAIWVFDSPDGSPIAYAQRASTDTNWRVQLVRANKDEWLRYDKATTPKEVEALLTALLRADDA